MSKRIGIVLNNVPAYSETFFHNKISGLLARGFDVTLFAEKNGNEVPQGWKVVSPRSLPGSMWLRSVYLGAAIIKLLATTSKTVFRFYKLERAAGRSNRTAIENLYINAHILSCKLDWIHYGFATVALRREHVAKAISAKMAVSFRGYDVGIYALKHPGCYRLVWENVDKVHTISDDLLVKAYKLGLPTDIPIVKITPAINANDFIVKPAEQNDHTINILTIARLSWKKGIQYALQAVMELKDKGLQVRYTIIGDGEDKEKLLFAAYQLGLTDNVVFEGRVKSNQVPEYFKRHQIYLQPSVQEGFCNAVLEAQAGNMLCIVTDAEGLQENVLHNKTGWVVKRRDVKAMATTIADVAGMDNAIKEEIRRNARTRVQQEFTLEKQITAFEEFYND
ncbi:MAG: glycosyltransferase [Bacteroidetes bacterium]|nr:glycosyltransferase [Bacteroidota bacterium]